jgi:signal transduction histidine kinase
MQAGNVTNIEVELHRKNKEDLICELSSTVIYDEYKDILGIVILLHDVSERKNIAEIQKKMIDENKKLLQQTIEYDRLRTEFFSNISHEFKTPLNIILSTIQLLNFIHKGSINNYSNFIVAFEKYIDIMKQNSYRLLRLVNNIIDITKIDTGFYEINLNNHNIVAVVEDITLSIAEYIKSKEIELIFDTDFEEKIIACDDEKIERIMLNLLSNAIKYTKPGGTIKVHIKNVDTNVMISVQDTGIGIPNDKLDVIFERFRQVDELLTRRAEGSGIGLSLVKSLVEAHGGTINVSSISGVGSEFVIMLPFRTLSNTESSYKHLDIINNDDQLHKNVERISIEFSDIYK